MCIYIYIYNNNNNDNNNNIILKIIIVIINNNNNNIYIYIYIYMFYRRSWASTRSMSLPVAAFGCGQMGSDRAIEAFAKARKTIAQET